MHELAPLKLAMPRTLDWENSAIRSRQLTGLAIRHVKAARQRASQLEAALSLPGPGGIAMLGDVECLWIGPGEWLLLASAEHVVQVAALERRLADVGAAIACAEGRIFVLSIDADADLIAGLTGLSKENLQPGCVARTRLADIPATIVAGAATNFRLLFDRVFAPHMRGWIDRAI